MIIKEYEFGELKKKYSDIGQRWFYFKMDVKTKYFLYIRSKYFSCKILLWSKTQVHKLSDTIDSLSMCRGENHPSRKRKEIIRSYNRDNNLNKVLK